MRILKTFLKLSFLIYILLISGSIFAQEEVVEAKDAAKDAQNPLANIISMPFQNNTDFGIGPYDQTANVTNIQPILPVTISESGWLLINRFIIPFPKFVPSTISEDASSISGIGDITYTGWFSPPGSGKVTWGIGPSMIFPTASDDRLGSGKFSIGPSLVFVYSDPKFMGAAIISNWFSVAGDADRQDINSFYFQYIFTYFLKNKWYASTAPIILANWEADQDQQWTVPFGGGFGKMFKLGKLPVDFQMQGFYNAVKPDYVGDWQLRVQLKLIFPKGKKK